MTLAEIRERYGVPAEVGMRVSWIWYGPDEIVQCDGMVEDVPFIGYLMMCQLVYDGEAQESRRKHAVKCTELTYYNDDGEVIWRPETAKS